MSDRKRRLTFEVTIICVMFQLQIQVSALCFIAGSVASCVSENLLSVPALPPHITHLFLEMNRIQEITSASLSQLPALKKLDLGHQHVPLVIRNNALRQQTNLTQLVLGLNRNLRLEPLAFDGLSSLSFLDLSYCDLNETVLSSSVLEPLASLETLDLSSNNIKRLRPAARLTNLAKVKDLTLKLNPLDQICEEDTAALRGANFRLVNLNSVRLGAMSSSEFGWRRCGNPFRNITFETLDLSNNNLSLQKLKRFLTAIRGTKINKIKLSGHYGKGFSFSNLPDPDNTTLMGLRDSDLQHLDLSRNSIFALKQGIFSSLRKVQLIDISQNCVNRIHKNAFSGLQENLQTLNLSHNLLGEIYSYTFASLTNLKVLDLSHNHIGALGYNSFTGLKSLQGLILTGNTIRTVGFPAALQSLQMLKLDDNKLKSVYGVSRFANTVSYLDVSNNRLTNLGDVSMFLSTLINLQFLLYSNNPVVRCTADSDIGPNALRLLHLDRTSLQSIWSRGQCLDLFHKFEHLRVLSLSHNDVRALPTGVFKGLAAIQEIDLSSNALTAIETSAIPPNLQKLNLADNFIAEPRPETFQTLQVLDLRMNRFLCGPGLKRFVAWIGETNVTLTGTAEQLTCEFPSSLRGASLMNFDASDDKQ